MTSGGYKVDVGGRGHFFAALLLLCIILNANQRTKSTNEDCQTSFMGWCWKVHQCTFSPWFASLCLQLWSVLCRHFVFHMHQNMGLPDKHCFGLEKQVYMYIPNLFSIPSYPVLPYMQALGSQVAGLIYKRFRFSMCTSVPFPPSHNLQHQFSMFLLGT